MRRDLEIEEEKIQPISIPEPRIKKFEEKEEFEAKKVTDTIEEEDGMEIPFEMISELVEENTENMKEKVPFLTYSYFMMRLLKYEDAGVQKNISLLKNANVICLTRFSYSERIQTPVRGANCLHLDVVDLKYLLHYFSIHNQ
jgi:hypothetical protein